MDRLYFMKILDLTIASLVPDHNTIWSFREKFKGHNLTKKNNETDYGDKDPITADSQYKFIRDFTLTTPSVHDSVNIYLKI